MSIFRHPSRHRAVGFAHNAGGRDSCGLLSVLHTNYKLGEHSRPQLVVWVANLRTNHDTMGVSIYGRVDFNHAAFKYPARVGHHSNLNRLTHSVEGAIAFQDVAQHPFSRNISNSVRRWRFSRLHLESRRSVDSSYLTVDWAADFHFCFSGASDRIEWLSLLNFIAKFRQSSNDRSLMRWKYLDRKGIIEIKLVIEINVTDTLLFKVEYKATHRL